MIDFHTHLGNVDFPRPGNRELTVEQLIDHMNRAGIATSVLLPLVSPEATGKFFTTFDAIEAANKYPERLIPFCCVDPRQENALDHINAFARMGCKGFGEHKVGLPIDDSRSVVLYRRCGEIGWCVVMHLDPHLNVDLPGLPRLEKVLKEIPETNFVMHGPAWWSEISTENEPRGGYPKGKIVAPGRADTLLSEHPNLYADLSAGSAYNALARDPEFASGFLDRHVKKLLYGTDYLRPFQSVASPEQLGIFHDPTLGKFRASNRETDSILNDNVIKLLTPKEGRT